MGLKTDDGPIVFEHPKFIWENHVQRWFKVSTSRQCSVVSRRKLIYRTRASVGRRTEYKEATMSVCTVFALEAPLSGHFLSVGRLDISMICSQPHHSVHSSWKPWKAPQIRTRAARSVAMLIQQPENHTTVSRWDVSDSDRCYDSTSL
jgi:hypothetical protein